MTGETQMGGFVWRLGVKSTVREDLNGAKAAVNEFDNKVKPTTTSVNKLTVSTKSITRPLMDMGQGLTAVGMAAYASGTLMGEAGEGYKVAGTGIMAVGSATMMTMPLLKAASAIMSGELSISLNNLSKMLGATRTELLLFSGAVGVIAVAGLYAYQSAAEAAKKATENKVNAIKMATKATDDYNSATQKRLDLEQQIAGIPQKEEDLRMKLIGDELTIRSAKMQQAALGKGATLLERDTAQYNVDRAQLQYERDWKAYFDLPKERMKLEGELSDTRAKQGMAALQGRSDLEKLYNPQSSVNPNMNPITQPTVLGVPTGTQITQIGPIYGKFSGETITIDNKNKATLGGY